MFLQKLLFIELAEKLPLVYDSDILGDFLKFSENMRRNHDTHVFLADKPLNEFPNLRNALWIQAVNRLIQNQELRMCKKCGPDSEPLLHTEGVSLCLAVRRRCQPDDVKRFFDVFLGYISDALCDQIQVIVSGQVRIERRGLDQCADMCVGAFPVQFPLVPMTTEHGYCSGRRMAQS